MVKQNWRKLEGGRLRAAGFIATDMTRRDWRKLEGGRLRAAGFLIVLGANS